MSAPHAPSPPRPTPEMHVLCLSGVTRSPPSFRSRTETQLTSQLLPIHICHRIIQHKGAQSEKDNYLSHPLPHFTKASLFGGGRGAVQEPTALFFWVLDPGLGLEHSDFTRG